MFGLPRVQIKGETRDMRHVKVRIEGSRLAHLLTMQEGRTVGYRVVKGLPEGTELLDVVWSPSKNCGVMVFKHESFEDVKSLRDVPYLPNDYIQLESFELSVFEQPEPEEEEPLIKVVPGSRVRKSDGE